MNIRHRITLLVVLTFVAISLIGGFAVYQSRSSTLEVRSVTQGVVPSALASVELVSQLKDVQLSVMVIMSSTDMNLAKQAAERVLATQARLQRAFDEQLTQATTEAEVGLVKQGNENLQNYFASIKETVDFKLQGQNELAQAVLAANVEGYLLELQNVTDNLQLQKRRNKDDAIAALNDNLINTTGTLGLVTVITVIILTTIGVLLYRQIIHPISEMEMKMTEIATSQDFSQRLPVHRLDEIGHSLQAFNLMVAKIEESTEQVKQKTADIHAMLHYIAQGILTVESGNRIHPEYSEHLERVLETKDIARRNLMDVVFSGTQCNADQLSQIETATSACIGEDEMNFSFNSHLLPTEITKAMTGGRQKILDLNWSPITAEDGTILRILLCVRDVTDLRALEAEANERKRELAMIGQILAVKQEKFFEFVTGSAEFLQENRQLVLSNENAADLAQRQEAIGLLFRNMHTVKGNARTFGLLHLTHVVHEAEQTYDQLRQDPNAAWDIALMLSQLDASQRALDEYARINEVKLGRRGPGRRGDVDKFLLVERQHIAATLELIDQADVASAAALRDALRQTRHNLELIGTETMEEVLSGVFDSLPELAKELGKTAPAVHVKSNGIVLRTQIGGMLKNVFMHLYRNSMDHGLEAAADRIASGKGARGSIELSMVMQGDNLMIRLRDDGRGLATGHIRRIAVERGLIAADAQLSPNEVAQLVFLPGFSTATEVSEISGRGVGMDAVKGFVKGAGGSIVLELDEPGGTEFVPFATVLTLPGKFVVAPAMRLIQQTA